MSPRDDSRGYQLGYYRHSPGLHDLEARRAKADKIVRCLADEMETGPVGIALDLGCSNGLVTEALEPLARVVAGLDIDRPALYASPSLRLPNIALIHGDAMALPFLSETVDLIVCAQVYEHVPDDVQLVREMERVLKPGGIIFFSGPNRLFPIEPHYGLPLLHWLPRRAADAWVRVTGKGTHYYERSRTTRGLRRLLYAFIIRDITPEAMRFEWTRREGLVATILSRVPIWFWRLTASLVPNVNWMLVKPEAPPT